MRRLLTGVFGGFSIIIACIGIYNYTHFNRLHSLQEELVKIDLIAQKIQQHKENIQQLSKHQQLFDSISRSSVSYTANNEIFWNSVSGDLSEYCKSTGKNGKDCGIAEIQLIINDLKRRERLLIKNAGELGFKENGLAGRLRESAHKLEKDFPLQKTRLLSLRRHEKDFLMRGEPEYAGKLLKDVDDWEKAADMPEEVVYYKLIFDTLSRRYLDLFSSQSQSSVIIADGVMETLQKTLRYKRSKLLQDSFSQSKNAGTTNLMTNCLAVLLAFSCTIFFIRLFSRQVKDLQKNMEQYIASNYQNSDSIMLKMPRNEFGKITMHFLQLTRKIKSDVQFLEDRVARRTQALERKNFQLEQQHLEITDSLNYARDLQQSFLVSRQKILRSFADSQVYYKPKHIVGGDFYWMKNVQNEIHDLVYFSLADCTGHGVPGALLSVMGMNALDELLDSEVYSPAELLNELRKLVRRRLNSETDKRYDGMDMSLFCWDKKTQVLTYSGAQRPLWIIREGTIIELAGQRMPIGHTFFEVNSFENQQIILQPEDKILLFTDGISDQFGGTDNKKAGKKRLREWILKSSNENLFNKLIERLESWRGNTEQTDDCTMILLSPIRENKAVLRTENAKDAVSI